MRSAGFAYALSMTLKSALIVAGAAIALVACAMVAAHTSAGGFVHGLFRHMHGQ